jgi:uncharacterized membrane protein
MELLSTLLEMFSVAVIVASVLVASGKFVVDLRGETRKAAYDGYRANLGRGILVGLELLVAADIIATVTAPLTWESVGLLGAIVAIRTFLSFSLETEIEGAWPWRRRARGGQEAEPR